MGAQLVVGKATEVTRAHALITHGSCVSAPNLSHQQRMQEDNALKLEVKSLQVIPDTKDEA